MSTIARSKLQPYHLPFIFCYAFALYFLSLPLEFPSDSDSSTSTCPPFTPTFLVNLRQFLLLPSPFFVIDNVVSNSTANISPSILFGPIARIPPSLLGRAGTALVGVLSMVLGLLLSYTYSAALGRWEKGKEKWSEVRREIRDGIRFVSLINPISMKAGNKNRDGDRYTFSPMTESHAFADFDKSPINDEENDGDDENDSVQERAEQITALLVAFAFALHHHLERSRPLISQAPLCDLLPVGYISSVKRTGRVRFSDNEIKGPRFEEKERLKGKQEADSDRSRVKNAQVGRDRRRSHSEISAATAKLGQRSSPDGLVSRQPDSTNSAASSKLESDINHKSSQVDDGGPEYSTEDDGIEAALILQEPPADVIDQQVRQLNLPKPEIVAQSEKTVSPVDFLAAVTDETPRVMHRYPPARPVLANPFPSNLPLSILRILEAYVHGMIKEGKSAKSDRSGSGWSAPQGERGLNMVKNLSKLLSETEHLSHGEVLATLSHPNPCSRILIALLYMLFRPTPTHTLHSPVPSLAHLPARYPCFTYPSIGSLDTVCECHCRLGLARCRSDEQGSRCCIWIFW